MVWNLRKRCVAALDLACAPVLGRVFGDVPVNGPGVALVRTALVTAVVSSLLFTALALFVDDNSALVQWETAGLRELHALRTAFMTTVMRAVDDAYDPLLLVWIVVGVALFLWRRQWRELALMASITLGGAVLVRLLKLALERTRPDVDRLVGGGSHSFPSGHTLGITLLAVWALYMAWTHTLCRLRRGACALVAIVLVGAVGASRVYLGAHYVSDVMGSILIGTAWACACIVAFYPARLRAGLSIGSY